MPEGSATPSGGSASRKRTRTRYPGIFLLPSGLYQVTFRAHGKQRSASFPRLADARAFQADTKAALQRGTWTDPAGARVELGEWVAYWLTQRRVAATTAAKDASRIRTHILPAFGTTQLGRIDPATVKAWVRRLEGAGLARSTVQGVYALMAQIMAEAVEADLIGRSPCRGVRFDPGRPEARRPRALGTAETARLLEALDGSPHTLVLTALGTGLRWGELAGLRRGNVHLLRRPPSVEVVESLHEAEGRLWYGPPKTRSSRRRVPLPAVVTHALSVHLPPNGDPADPVFRSPQGRLLRRHNFHVQTWRPATEAAGLDGLHFHDLRSTYSSWLADAGVPEIIIAAVLGHKVGRSITAGYTQVISGFEGRVLEVLDERLSVAELGHGTGSR